MARQPDSQTFELGHWESMQISVALDKLAEDYETPNPLLHDADNQNRADWGKAVRELQTMFSFGTNTVTQTLERQ